MIFLSLQNYSISPKYCHQYQKKCRSCPKLACIPSFSPLFSTKSPFSFLFSFIFLISSFRHLFSFLSVISFCLFSLFLFSFLFLSSFGLSHPRLRRPVLFLLLQDAVVLALSLFKAIPSLCYLACPSRPFSLQKHPLLCDFSQPNIPKPDKIPSMLQSKD